MRFANKPRFDNTGVWHTSEMCCLVQPPVLTVTRGFCPCNTMGLVVEKRDVGRVWIINAFKAEATQRPVPNEQGKNIEEKEF